MIKPAYCLKEKNQLSLRIGHSLVKLEFRSLKDDVSNLVDNCPSGSEEGTEKLSMYLHYVAINSP